MMNCIKYISIFCIYFIALFNFLGAQTPYSKTYTTHDGLIHPQVTALFKDSRNYLWIGTKGGVSKFNGKSFENFNQRQLGFSEDVFQIYEDYNHFIWAISKQGVSIYDGKDWQNFKCPTSMKDISLCFKQDTFYFFDKNNNLNFFTNRRFFPIRSTNKSGKEPRNIFYCKLTDHLYIQFNNTYDLGILENDTIYNFKSFQINELGLYSNLMTYVRRSFKHDSALIYDLDDHLIDRIPVSKIAGEVTYNQDSKKINLLWSSTEGLLNKNSSINEFFNQSKNKSDITVVLIDEYNYWLGSERGLIQVPKSGFVFYNKDSIPYPWGIIEDENNNILVGDFLNGLFKISPDHRIKNICRKPKWYQHPCKNSTGTIYFNNEDQIFSCQNEKLEVIPELKDKQNGFTGTLYLFWSEHLNKLVCAQKGGICLFDPKNKNSEYIKWDFGDFANRFVRCIENDSKEILWCGSTAGLVAFDPATLQKKYYTYDTTYFPANGINSICHVGDSILYLGATNGLWKFNQFTKSCLQILKTSINHSVSSLLSYKDSLLICGHHQGLTVIKLNELNQGIESFREFNYFNGFPGLIPDQNTSYIDAQGNFWVGAFDRLCAISVHSLWHEEEVMRIQFTKLNSINIVYGESKLISKYGKGIEIEFDVIGQLRPVEPKFRYRIVNTSKWSDWFSYQHFILPELSSGNYQLELESDSGLDETGHSKNKAILHFKVDQKLWLEPWFNRWLTIISFLILAGLGVYMYRLQMSRRKILELEQESKYYQARMLTAQLNPHFMSNFLTSIQNSVNFQDTQKANDKLLQVASFLRKFLGSLKSKEKTGLIQLNEELEIIRIFLEMQNVLHNGHLDWSIQMSPDFDPTEWLVPPLLLQPYVENAIVWGIDCKEIKKGIVKVSIQESYSELIIEIQDDGIGIEQSQKRQADRERSTEESGALIVKQRIALLKTLGFDIKFEIKSNEYGTTVQLTYPKIKT